MSCMSKMYRPPLCRGCVGVDMCMVIPRGGCRMYEPNRAQRRRNNARLICLASWAALVVLIGSSWLWGFVRGIAAR